MEARQRLHGRQPATPVLQILPTFAWRHSQLLLLQGRGARIVAAGANYLPGVRIPGDCCHLIPRQLGLRARLRAATRWSAREATAWRGTLVWYTGWTPHAQTRLLVNGFPTRNEHPARDEVMLDFALMPIYRRQPAAYWIRAFIDPSPFPAN